MYIWTKALWPLFTAFLALLPKAGEKRMTGLRGRPSQANVEKFLSNYAQRLPIQARALFEANPFLALDMLNAYRRDVTEAEEAFLEDTSDGVFQGMRNGEPVQNRIPRLVQRAGEGFRIARRGRRTNLGDCALPQRKQWCAVPGKPTSSILNGGPSRAKFAGGSQTPR